MKGESTAKPKYAGMQIVYPYGATLSTQRPAAPILASGLISFPIHRPLGIVQSSYIIKNHLIEEKIMTNISCN
jgi:hypothetical protein